ncbi:MAG: mechanosensitive ion channel domain-containing protein [Pseudomonadota bacterium]
MDWLMPFVERAGRQALALISTPETYTQFGIILGAIMIAWLVAAALSGRIHAAHGRTQPEAERAIIRFLDSIRSLFFPAFAIVALSAATSFSETLAADNTIVKGAQGLAIIALLYRIANRFLQSPILISVLKWVGIPIAALYAFDVLDDVIAALDSAAVEIGNIRFSAYGVVRTLLFGVILFWLGRASNRTGKRVIRAQQAFDIGTQEVLAKLLEIFIYVAIFLVLINIMGLDLTALAVFGGALGVGLGFGLQQIAANFISGLIILLDRSVTVGDYIELEDGRAGTLRELTMRSATLETFEGKDIMVPNEKFITTSFVNWTHNNQKQRYSLTFQVAYATDLEKLFDIVRDIVVSHPQVLSGDDLPLAERPDAEIKSFDDSGITILVEFWMNGIDDGDNRVGADLNMMIWTALKTHGIQIPFPQREIRILGEEAGV